jgi:2-desacetyl-2-hydroxyethyl bacteriochlorophyllide A dehydrogenase
MPVSQSRWTAGEITYISFMAQQSGTPSRSDDSRVIMMTRSIVRIPMRLQHNILVWSLWTLLSSTSALPPSRSSPALLLLLDVDNTLYDETQARLEQQIVHRIHHQTQVPPEWADALHATYGSTIAGLDRTQWLECSHEERMRRHQAYYDTVYRNLDFRRLLSWEGGAVQDLEQPKKTGYDLHGGRVVNPSLLRTQLHKAATTYNMQLHLASNSPRHHVETVLQAMGMTKLPWSRIITPHASNSFATKLDGTAFLKDQVALDGTNAILIDDSLRNLEAFSSAVLNKDNTIHCNNTDPHASIHVAIGRALGWIDRHFQFSDTAYLAAKNQVDQISIHAETWNLLRKELAESSLCTSRLIIVDIGAGLLSMLDVSLHGSSSERLAPLWSYDDDNDTVTAVDYYAYEPNGTLKDLIMARLEQWGFRRIDSESSSSSSSSSYQIFRRGVNYTVHVCFESFENSHIPKPASPPHLIMGCCFADLHDPYRLIPSIMAQFLTATTTHREDMDRNSTLLYFPITFCGDSQFSPPQPFQDGRIPSDTLAFQIYSEALRDMGHHLDPRRLQSVVEDFGGKLIGQGPSTWTIEPNRNTVLWETMLYFFGTVGAPKLNALSWNARGWLDRARMSRHSIKVANVDLLFRLPWLGKWSFKQECAEPEEPNESNSRFEELLFTGPRSVSVVEKVSRPLEADELRIQSEYSLISTGTELKVFMGQFDDAPLDVSIESMKDDRLRYPLAYGYSLVGRVVECGSGLDGSEWVGRRVFCFNAHASQAVAKASSVHLVPDDCSSLDAIFMPSVETALSLVQEARPVLGENIGVFGQGLIGLLVTALLHQFRIAGSQSFGLATAYDARLDRLMLSSRMGASQALLPTTNASQAFDVTIEVSGNNKALQSAIDATLPGGRVVIGSWYGNQQVPLRLGMDFHRSHKTLLASQVSCIPVPLSGTWNKARRFQLAWELTKQLEPSRLLLSKPMRLRDAHFAYTSLEDGRELVSAFRY